MIAVAFGAKIGSMTIASATNHFDDLTRVAKK
jgi:hypothetical protein